MLHKIKKHRFFPHFLVILVLVVLAIVFFFLFYQKAYSGIRIIDIHEHIQSRKKADELILAMDTLGIEKTVLPPSPWETLTLNGAKSFTRYQENTDEILKIAEIYPDRFVPLCTVSPLNSNALEIFQDCHKRGGKGLKLYNGHSYYYEIFGLPLDTPSMMPVYAYAERNNLPVLYHINLKKYKNELENILQQHPDLVINVPHYMVSSIESDKVKQMLDKYTNLYTDISFGSPEFFAAGFRRISRNPQKYIDFFEEYPDRILFGTDMVLTDIEKKDQEFMEKTLQCYKDILEKRHFVCEPVYQYYKAQADRYKEIYEICKPKNGAYCKEKKEKMESYTSWYEETRILNGLHLNSDILKKIYQENPERWLRANQD